MIRSCKYGMCFLYGHLEPGSKLLSSVFEIAAPGIRNAEEIQDISIAIADALNTYGNSDIACAVLGLYGAVVSQSKIDEMRLKHLSARQEEAEMQRKLESVKNARNQPDTTGGGGA